MAGSPVTGPGFPDPARGITRLAGSPAVTAGNAPVRYDRRMAYDEDLATRIRDLIGPDPELTEKKMFGGLAFLIRGHMAISASGQGGVLVHVGPGRSGDLVATPVTAGISSRSRTHG